MVSRRGHEMWFVGPRLRYHKCARFVAPRLCYNKCAWFVGPRLCQPNVYLKIVRSTKQVTRNIIQSERDVSRVTPEKIMMTCVIFFLHYILLVWKVGHVNHVGGNEKCSQSFGYRDSVGGIETCYGRGGAVFESRWGDFFRARSGRPRGPHSVLHN